MESAAEVGAQCAEPARGTLGFLSADFLFRVKYLALQIRERYGVGVAQPEPSHTCRGEIKGHGAAESARAYYECCRLEQPLLPLKSDFGEHCLS